MTITFEFLKTDKCPVCGEVTIVAEDIEVGYDGEIREHTHGGKWEKRMFLCGQQVEYSPNFSKDVLSDYHTCKNDPVKNEYINKKHILYGKINDLIIEESDLTKEDTSELKRNIQRVLN